MAEEDLDLEDDDLDLGGDDFAGELDEMMGDDELGDDSSGGDESDSELDSFFEDLSSIEDMDEGDSEPSEDVAEEIEADVEVQKEPAKTKQKAAPTGEKKGGKLKLILPLLLILLGGTGGGLWFFGFFDDSAPLQEEEITMAEVPSLQTIPVEQQMVPQQPVKPIIAVEPPPPPVKPMVPRTRYLVQVATCTYQVCKNDYMDSLRRVGEPVFQRSSGEKYDFIELISKDVYNYRDASELAHEINVKNTMAGKASVKSQSNGYRITMGSFPALDRAKEVKFNIESIFPGKNVTFSMEHIRKDYTTTKIFAGPYDSKSEAKKVLADLRSKDKFKGAFIVLF